MRTHRLPVRRGVTFLELLVATLILSVVAAAGVVTWGMTSRVPEITRLTEMGSILAVRQLESLKVLGYDNIVDTKLILPVFYFDKYGAPISVPTGQKTAPANAVYLIKYS